MSLIAAGFISLDSTFNAAKIFPTLLKNAIEKWRVQRRGREGTGADFMSQTRHFMEYMRKPMRLS